MDETARADHALLGPLNSEDEARAWVLSLVEQCEQVRREIDWATMVREQRKLFCRWMILRGHAHGALSALKRCKRISDECHNELRGRILATEQPTVTSDILPFEGV